MFECNICFKSYQDISEEYKGSVPGSTKRFLSLSFDLWKCPHCGTIHSEGKVDFADIYSDYPLFEMKPNFFNRGTMRNLLKRLQKAGLKKSSRILDYGCGNGCFVDFLKKNGYEKVEGFDPYFAKYSKIPDDNSFDFVIANDVIEHCDDPRDMIKDCLRKLKKGGLLYVGTCDSTDVDMKKLENYIMLLHQPHHRTILSEKWLKQIFLDFPVAVRATYHRSYMDTWRPFSNYRFLHEYFRASGNDLTSAFHQSPVKVFLRNPLLFFWGFFGYLFPQTAEPAIVLRKLGGSHLMETKNKAKVCLITGATSGIGKEAAIQLAKKGFRVIFTARNEKKGEAVKEEIIMASDNKNVEMLVCDLSSLASIRNACREFKLKHKRLDVLINNAGVLERHFKLSSDGIEMTIAVNYLAPFLMTNLLLDLLKSSAPARIITVSSEAHRYGKIDFDDLEMKKKFNGLKAYNQSKLANILFTKKLSEILEGTGVTANCLHPGEVKTKIFKNLNIFRKIYFSIIFALKQSSVAKAAEKLVYLADAQEIKNVSGQYFLNNKIVSPSLQSGYQEVARRLWEKSANYVGLE